MTGEKTKAFDREAMAKWYAQRHLKTDEAIVEINYLPEDAAANEIRFVEVNKLVSPSTPMEPVDFGVDIGELGEHTLFVLDVTPEQWTAIQKGELRLPTGWKLDNRTTFGRKR